MQSLVDGILLWQGACEFISASRKLEPLGFDRDRAWREIHRLHRACRLQSIQSAWIIKFSLNEIIIPRNSLVLCGPAGSGKYRLNGETQSNTPVRISRSLNRRLQRPAG